MVYRRYKWFQILSAIALFGSYQLLSMSWISKYEIKQVYDFIVDVKVTDTQDCKEHSEVVTENQLDIDSLGNLLVAHGCICVITCLLMMTNKSCVDYIFIGGAKP